MNNEMQDLKFTTAGDFMKMTEEPHHNYCTTKGLGLGIPNYYYWYGWNAYSWISDCLSR